QNRILWVSFVMLIVVQVFSYNFTVTLPLFVTDSLHESGSMFTLLYSLFGAGAVVSALLVAHRNLVRMAHILWGALALGGAMLVLSFVPNAGFAMPAVFLVGMGSILYLTATTAIVQTESEREMHGRVLALQTVILGGSSLIGGPLLGWVADAMGGRAPMIIGAVAAIASAVFGYYACRHHWQGVAAHV